MRSNTHKDTGPEIRVRKLLHSLGYRFRLHRTDLPGKPDIVLPKSKLVIFVNGCFWHQHPGCPKASIPKTNIEFWKSKFQANRKRDIKNQIQLTEQGWQVVVIWECQTSDKEKLTKLLELYLK
ncbi:DNA mismatch endonuclease Vsr [Marinobacter halodurans]|uniref:DNA mismatch endonuclease Vsr n=2 Tax=Marinobacter halodurans TaxID=2528979 RepID=A0ABY1ZIH7_9GAMM|nr:DNA mismatch endonuclease Vsr [Marinobacter halodurans]